MTDFALPDLSGRWVTLSQFRGQRVLLIFFDPGCGFCRRMLPDLAALSAEAAPGRPVPLVVSTGNPAENRRLVDEHGIHCTVLIQEGREVAALYRASGTPSGYLLDEHGVTASPLTSGAAALRALAESEVALDPSPSGALDIAAEPLPPIRLTPSSTAPRPRVGMLRRTSACLLSAVER